MLYITNNISYMIIALFGTSTFVFFTRFFQQLGDEIPKLDSLIGSPGNLQVAIYSLLAALVTFFVKQATSIKNIETSTKNTETHLGKLVDIWTEAIKDIKGHGIAKDIKDSNETLKKIAVMQRETLRGKSNDSLVRRLPSFDDDEE